MKRLITTLSVLVLMASAARADAQLYVFEGCDEGRSCHRVEVTRSLWSFPSPPPVLGDLVFRNVYSFLGSTVWLERGGFEYCSTGCAWSVNLPSPSVQSWSDFFHASNQCFSWQPCLGKDGWDPFRVIYAYDGWQPESISVNVGYASEPGRIRSIQLTPIAVPEPTAALLVFAGAAGLVAVSHRRRLS